jgi:hypothetical protein
MRCLTLSANEEAAATPASAGKLLGRKGAGHCCDDVVNCTEPLTRVVVEVDGEILTMTKGLVGKTLRRLEDPGTVIRQLRSVLAILERVAGLVLLLLLLRPLPLAIAHNPSPR